LSFVCLLAVRCAAAATSSRRASFYHDVKCHYDCQDIYGAYHTYNQNDFGPAHVNLHKRYGNYDKHCNSPRQNPAPTRSCAKPASPRPVSGAGSSASWKYRLPPSLTVITPPPRPQDRNGKLHVHSSRPFKTKYFRAGASSVTAPACEGLACRHRLFQGFCQRRAVGVIGACLTKQRQTGPKLAIIGSAKDSAYM
jgi:hypothetical protein